MSEYGLLIDYEYCTGCHACEVACKQEYHRAAGKVGGIKVMEFVEELPDGAADVTFFPLLTKRCMFCAPRIKRGLLPACVKHCMAECLTFGPVETLARSIPHSRKAVLWTQSKDDQ